MNETVTAPALVLTKCRRSGCETKGTGLYCDLPEHQNYAAMEIARAHAGVPHEDGDRVAWARNRITELPLGST